MCLGTPKPPTPPPPPMMPPPPKPQAPPPPPAPAPQALQPQAARPTLRTGATKRSTSGRERTSTSSLRSGLNINTGSDGGLNV